jgi:uncharacterized protein (DUF1697 family)
MRYVALLRGINVGGNHLIRMSDLRTCFEAQALGDVATYIQSGNVVFTSAAPAAEIERRLEAALAATFDCHTSVMLRSRKQMQDIVARAPKGFGSKPVDYRYDVIFLKAPFTATTAMPQVKTKPGVDVATPGPGVVYFSRLVRKATQSQLGRITTQPVYKSLTIRNWRTTSKLLEMLDIV